MNFYVFFIDSENKQFVEWYVHVSPVPDCSISQYTNNINIENSIFVYDVVLVHFKSITLCLLIVFRSGTLDVPYLLISLRNFLWFAGKTRTVANCRTYLTTLLPESLRLYCARVMRTYTICCYSVARRADYIYIYYR